VTAGEPLIRWDWLLSHLPEIGQRIGEHLVLTFIAVALGFVLAFILGLASVRWGWVYPPVTWVTGVLYTIPSLALFALLIPFTGLSLVTAEIGLVGYTLLILVRGIVGGIQSVPADVREAAIAMGYTPRQLLWKVELPLAAGIIVASLRVATVTTIGLTTVTALIGQGGLGYLILDRILRFFSPPLIVGAVLSVLLALLADALLVFVHRLATPWSRAAR